MQNSRVRSRNIQAEAERSVRDYRSRRKQFVKLIQRQEPLAAKNPDAYRRKVLAFASLGYAYILLVLLLLVALTVALVWLMLASEHLGVTAIKLGFFLVVIIGVVVKSLFISLPAPEGKRVSREEAPELWKEVDTLCRSLGAPPIDEIVVDFQMNAAAAQRPRFGFFGKNRNYLVLGLPLLYGLPTEEMQSVLAHEFGHFSGQHGKMGGRIYRLNESFATIQGSLRTSSANLLFRPFYNWFQPRFDAISFVLRRQNEYQADSAARRISGGAAARALMRLSYLGKAVDAGLWTKLSDLPKSQPAPPPEPFADIAGALAKGTEEVDVRALLEHELAEGTGYEDTHPSLADRLRAMDAMPKDLDAAVEEMKQVSGESAAEHYFGPFLPRLLSYLNQEYVKGMTGPWLERHRQYKKETQKLEELEKLVETQPLNRTEQLDLAFLTLRLRDPKDGLRLFQELHDAEPDDPKALYGLGEAKLTLGDGEGEEHLRAATRINVAYFEPAIQEIVDFRNRHGWSKGSGIAELREEFLEWSQVAGLVRRERLNVKATDEFTNSTLRPEQREDLARQLAARPDIKRAYIVSKVIRLDAVQRYNILVIVPKGALLTTSEKNNKFVQKVIREVKFPTEVTVLIPTDWGRWKKPLAKIGDALLYER